MKEMINDGYFINDTESQGNQEKYYVYHDPGKKVGMLSSRYNKVGCKIDLERWLEEQGYTISLERRLAQQGLTVIGTYYDLTEASEDARMFQIHLGYGGGKVPCVNLSEPRECMEKRNTIRAILERLFLADEIDVRYFADGLVSALSALVHMHEDEVWDYIADEYDYDEEGGVWTAKQDKVSK